MRLRPQTDSDEHILMYFASEYGSTTKQYASLSLIENQVVFTLNRPNKGNIAKLIILISVFRSGEDAK